MRYDEPSGYWTPDIFSGGPGTYLRRSGVIDFALQFSTGRRTVIQAGGHIGVWPIKLSEHFARVLSFEPVQSNWECLERNAVRPNVALYNEALGAENGTIKINYRTKSSGGHSVATRLDKPHVTVPLRALDSLGLPDVDAMFLDIEGYEIQTLKGARNILKKQKPLLVIENNGCSKQFGYPMDALAKFLKPYGYRFVDRYGDEDDIFVASGTS
jgi:FkbM family methyltransferase